MSPEELARSRAYYGGADISSPADAPPPIVPGAIGPPLPPGIIGPPTPVTDLGELGGPPVSQPAEPPPKRFSWNAPGYENVHRPAFSGEPSPTDLGELGGPPVGAPSPATFARPPAQPDTEPNKPAVSPEAEKAAKALAYYGGAGAPAKPTMRGGGGGAPSVPSEYKRAQADLLGTYDAEKRALQEGANAEQAKGEMIAAGAQDLAQQKQVQAQNAEMEARDAAHHFQTYQEETQRQIDDVRQQKINPNRAYSDSGSAVLSVIGGMLGGLYQGINHMEKNPFIEQMNRVIDRDIAAQETDLRTKKESIAERKGLLSEMRGIYKDDALARAQAKNLYLEGAKEDILAQAAQYDSPAIQARADQGASIITRAQDGLKLQQLQQEAAARAAAAAAAERQRQQDFENALKLQDAQNKTLLANAQAQKDLRAGNEKSDEQQEKLGKELSDPKLIAARKTIDDIKTKVMRGRDESGNAAYDNTTRIPGTGRSADTREDLFPGERPSLAAGFIPGYGLAHSVGKLTPEERVGRQEWSRLFDAYRVEVTGAGASVEELDRLKLSFQGANSAAEQQSAIRLADGMLAERESRIKAGAPPEVARRYDARVKQERAARPGVVQREPVK